MSETKTCSVKSAGKEVGKAEYESYDSLAEAAEDLGEDRIVGLVNTQVKTNAMNEVRASASGKPTKTALRNQATMELVEEGKFAAVAGDMAAVDKLISQRVAEIESRKKEAVVAEAEEAPEAPENDEDLDDEDEDEDEDDEDDE